MKLKKIHLRNFRRLEDIEIGFENEETVFVGPNNSGKTSATTAFLLFLVSADFRIHDFSVSKITDIDAFGFKDDPNIKSFPSIGMDLWFSVDPDIEYGRVSHLLPSVSVDFEEVGVQLEYCVKDIGKLKFEYISAFPPLENGERQKSLSHFLSLQGNLNRHFSISYCALENTEDGTVALPRDPKEGKRVLRSLIRVDFVDAQRNFDDYETGRSKRLSTAFAAFYKKNLEQVQTSKSKRRSEPSNRRKQPKTQ